MTDTLVQRIRKSNGTPKGVLVARKINDTTVAVGWSLCKKPDSFNMEWGTRIAVGRAERFNPALVPHSIKSDFGEFLTRCSRYFKGQEIIGLKLFQENC